MRTTHDILNRCREEFGDHIGRYVDEEADKLPFSAPGVSPIERIMGLALYHCVCLYNFLAAMRNAGPVSCFYTCTNESFEALDKMAGNNTMAIWHQVKVGQFTADFVARYSAKGKTIWVAIECDGHDFHEKTKEQAAHDRRRDRLFQSRGLAIFRYTGSEIWKDPTGSAIEALQYAQDKVLD